MNYNLFNDDCLKVMKDIEDDSIDLIVTDPPYLIDYKTNRRLNKEHKFCKSILNDTNEQCISDYIKESYRILKDNTAMYIFCNSNKVDFFKRELEKSGFVIKNMIIWEKNNWTAGDLKAQYGKQYEIIFLVNKGRKFINGKRLSDIWKYDRVSPNKALHQNQKPVELLKQCILKHSNENDLVFDGFMGSGSTGIACLETNRRFIGVELDKEYFDIAEERLKKCIGEI